MSSTRRRHRCSGSSCPSTPCTWPRRLPGRHRRKQPCRRWRRCTAWWRTGGSACCSARPSRTLRWCTSSTRRRHRCSGSSCPSTTCTWQRRLPGTRRRQQRCRRWRTCTAWSRTDDRATRWAIRSRSRRCRRSPTQRTRRIRCCPSTCRMCTRRTPTRVGRRWRASRSWIPGQRGMPRDRRMPSCRCPGCTCGRQRCTSRTRQWP